MYLSYFPFLHTFQHLFQRHFRVVLAEYLLLYLELTVLYGGDGEAIDVADGAVEHMQAGEDTHLHVLFTQGLVVLAQALEAVVIDGVQRLFNLPPVACADIYVPVAAGIQFLDDLGALEDEVLQEPDGSLALSQ